MSKAPSERRLAGRVLARRDMGKLVFLDLVDRSGRIQLLCPSGAHRRGRRPPRRHRRRDRQADEVRRGEPSLIVDELVLLARIRSPLPDTFHGLTDVEQRYRRRYLDLLMNEETRADFLLRARMVAAIRRDLDEDGFVEVETPVLQPRYGGAFAGRSSTHHNELDQDLYLRIATELYLKRLIVGGPRDASTRSAGTSATRASRSSTTRSSRCSSGTRRTPTTATRWSASRSSSRRSRARRSGRRR